MDRELWRRLKQEPNAGKSTLQIESERSQQMYQASLQNIKVKPTPAARESAVSRFRAIKASNAAEKATADLDAVNQRERDIQQLLLAALEVASPTETTQVMATITPTMLRQMALRSADFDIAEYVHAELMRIRAVKELGL